MAIGVDNVGSFEPMNFPGGVFDYPGVMLDNLVRGRFGEFNPGRMSPDDRKDLADRFEQVAGSNPALNALVGVATNPWVWLSIPALVAFRNAPATHVLTQGPSRSALLRKNGPLLANLGFGKRELSFLTANEEFIDTFIPWALQKKNDAYQGVSGRWGNEFAEVMTEVLENVREKTGTKVKSLQEAGVGGDADIARKLNAAISAKLHGLDKVDDTVQGAMTLRATNEGKDIGVQEALKLLAENPRAAVKISLETSKKTSQSKKLLDSEKLDSFLREFGADKLVDKVNRINDEMWVTLYGKDEFLDGAGRIKKEFLDESGRLRSDLDVVDHNKLARHARENVKMNRDGKSRNRNNLVESFRNVLRPGKVNQELKGHEMMDTLLSDDMMLLLQHQEMLRGLGVTDFSTEVYQAALRNSLSRQTHYAPRNDARVFWRNPKSPGRVAEDLGNEALEQADAASDQMSALSASFERARTPDQVVWDDDDLNLLSDLVEDSPDGRALFGQMVERGRKRKEELMLLEPGEETRILHGLGFEQSYRKHIDKSARSYARNVVEVDGELMEKFRGDLREMKQAAKERRKRTRYEGMDEASYQREFETKHRNRTFEPGWDGTEQGFWEEGLQRGRGETGPMGGFSYADLEKAAFQLVKGGDRSSAERLKYLWVPLSEGKRTVQSGLLTGMVLKSRDAARRFVDSPAGLGLKESGKPGEKLFQAMSQFANDASWMEDPMRADRGLAKFFYGSTLGINMMSVMLNSFQPLMTTSRYVDFQDLVGGYKDAFGAMYRYAKLRTEGVGGAQGFRDKMLLGAHNKAKKAELWKKAVAMEGDPFDVSLVAGIGEESLEILDATSRLEASSLRRGPLDALDDVNEVMLKLFEKAEYMNRLVTTRAVMRKAAREGSLQSQPGLVARRAREATELTQFGASFLNTPAAMVDKVSGRNLAEGILTQPLVRQFMTFPMRMSTMLMHGSPKTAVMRNGKVMYPQLNTTGAGALGRVVAGRGGEGDAENAMAFFAGFRDWARAMAIGAVTYEVGKEMFGADLSGASVLGGSYVGALRSDGPLGLLPSSPFVSTALSPLVWALTGKDYHESFRSVLPTLVPGGVSLSRALGIAPNLPLGPFEPVQRTYVDWGRKTAEGRYPIFTHDGRLISYESRTSLSARAAGVDFSSYRDEGEFLRYMRNIREETVEQRADMIRAMVTGDMTSAERIAQGYQRKYGHQLMVNERQVQAFVDNQNRTRIERALEGAPAAMRPEFVQMAANTFGQRLGMSPEQFAGALTAKQRSGSRTGTVELGPEVREMVRDMVEGMKAGVRETGMEPAPGGAWQPWTPFGSLR